MGLNNLLKAIHGVPIVTQRLRTHCCLSEGVVPSLALLSGLGIQHCCKLWHKSQMWLESSTTVAVVQASAAAPIQTLAQELPYVPGVAVEKKKKSNIQLCAVERCTQSNVNDKK